MNTMESRRIVCRKGHVVAMLKTDPGHEGDEFAQSVIDRYDGTCIYCAESLDFQRAEVSDYERWASREDGRYVGTGAPDA